jgi:hypothetical protein
MLPFLLARSELSATNFNGAQTLTAFFYFELNLVVVANLIDEARYVNEYVLAGSGVVDETKTFGFIEEFYGSC